MTWPQDITKDKSGEFAFASYEGVGGASLPTGTRLGCLVGTMLNREPLVPRDRVLQVERTLIPMFRSDRTVRARCAGVGVLTRKQAQSWGAVVPTARASGLTQDIRRATPCAAHDRLEFDVPVQTSGDILARMVVRALKIVESCRIVEQAPGQMPAGAIHGGDFVGVPYGEAVARIEGPRGEVIYYVASDGPDIPRRVKVRTPSFMNMPTVRVMLQGASLADVPLIQASIDPCYSCTDR